MQSVGAPTGRVAQSAVWTGEELIICGGWPGYSSTSPGNTVIRGHNWGGRYQPATDSWAEDGVPPSTREGHGAVWTGEKMIVWGGYNAEIQGDGAEYDVISKTWRRLPAQGAPSARTHQGTVWNGTVMFVWGGFGQGGYLNDGGRYDPASRAWKGMTTSNAPSAREWVEPVWTGSKMIVWGGRAADDYRHDGAVYDPGSDEWTAMNTNGAPRGRLGHSMAWTGRELIVWSGFGWESLTPKFDNHLGDGARYDIATGEWRAISEAGAPTARSGHSTIWTGTKMMVWGGGTREGLVNTGGIYDPAADSWSAIPMEGAPQPRNGHAAVWTGEEMVVWGGRTTGFQNLPVALNDGARYDPVANKWTAMEFEAGAKPRFGHSAIWTGTDMIIWGGHDVGNSGIEQYWNDTWSYLPTAPKLVMGLPGVNREISWRYPASGFVLERSSGLSGGWNWVVQKPIRDGESWRVADDAEPAEKGFYRLRKFD